MPSETVHTLLAGLIDYAGLFPPAALNMGAAIREFSRRHRGKDSWILGRFVVPIARLDEFEMAARRSLPRDPSVKPWSLSVLVEGDLEVVRRRIAAFNRTHAPAQAGRAAISAVELQASDAGDVAQAARAFDGLEIYYEFPLESDPGRLMAAVAASGGRAKIRTGGITPEAFPDTAALMRFLHAAVRSSVAFKATAGLHHPLRGEYRVTYEDDSPTAVMHGFLNLFLAAIWLQEGEIDETEVYDLLEERSSAAIAFSDDEVAWRDHRLDHEVLAEARRKFAVSYGSCSFSEPVRDMRVLKLL